MAKDKAPNIDVSDVEAAEKEKILAALKKERAAHAATKTQLQELTQANVLGANPNAEALASHVDALVRAGLAKHAAKIHAKDCHA